jgi:hypothetical protein
LVIAALALVPGPARAAVHEVASLPGDGELGLRGPAFTGDDPDDKADRLEAQNRWKQRLSVAGCALPLHPGPTICKEGVSGSSPERGPY